MGRISRRGFTVAAAGVMSAMLVTGESSALEAGNPDSAPNGAPGGDPERSRRKREFRGMWIATVVNVDWPSRPGLTPDRQRDELITLLETAVDRRLNAVILQLRPTADAFWPSPYEPWSEYLTGTQGRDPGWDPLAFAVREAHRRRLELHGWFNPYRIANHTDPGKLIATHPARIHPEWVVPYGGKLYYNPGLPEVRRFVQDAMLDAVTRYDLDGVHFDDYFYPYPVTGQRFDDDAAYARHGAGFPDRAAWRRDNIDRLVREMGERIKRRKRHVRFGISPFAVWRNKTTDPLGSATRAGVETYDDLGADTRKWVREEWIDYIVPQVYWHIGFAAADYATLVPWWAETVRGTDVHLYIGEALYRAGDPAQPAPWQDPAELSRHLALARNHPEVLGHVYFSAKQVATDPIKAMARVVEDHYPRRARPPR
ncbi:glycoside hydrolase family 10 protein [Streptomyces sp. ISL-11]|uniref:glycoside hydrolase family 10 protein n=1 Tax=Streptomyces sp. ISL-11 TaxID=2819174 RepID=UPI001BEA8168|nr:family 10 glycosylhydrolase [Streptomyces sp. ISL-11]MBT2384775.1 family 10 glycosylhydrolase [Streptomyces sp. ISL-11]